MASMTLGSKPEVFSLKGKSWICASGLPSDVCVKVGDYSFHLHKFPLLSRSLLLEKLIHESSDCQKNVDDCVVLSLHELPGGANSFLSVAKFCYGVKFEVTSANVAGLRCASEYLQMTEDYGEQNLISLTEIFLNEVFRSWGDIIKALDSCQALLPHSEELHIVSRCIDSLAAKAYSITSLKSASNVSKSSSRRGDWLYEDVSVLELPLFKRLILAFGSTGMKTEQTAGALIFYAKKYLPLSGRQSGCRLRNSVPKMVALSDKDQRTLVEEIVTLLPDQSGAVPASFLLRLLRISKILEAGPSCLDLLERKIGTQLDQAVVQDLLIPNTCYSVDTLYDIECVQRIVNHFLVVNQNDADFNFKSIITEEGRPSYSSSRGVVPINMVADLLDDYLAEVAADANLKSEKFLSLASAIPNQARSQDDGIYRAIDIYLKAHPLLTDPEREWLCRVINCEKLSLEASSHAAQNQRLPLRFVIQVLYFEQLRLRTSVACCLLIADNKDDSQDLADGHNRSNCKGGEVFNFEEMRKRVSELEKECDSMKVEIKKIVKTKGTWNNLLKRFKMKSSTLPCYGDAIRPSIQDVLSIKHDQDDEFPE